MIRYLQNVIFFIGLVVVLSVTVPAQNEDRPVYRVSPDGIDDPARDGQNQPWRSIGFALASLPGEGGAIVIAASGEYPRVSTTRPFEREVVIQAEIPHCCTIRPGGDNGPVLFNGATYICFL